MSCEELSRLEDETIAKGGELLLENLGREDLPRPVGKVVGLVDQENRLAQVFARQVPQRGRGLEDVVVVRDDRIGAVGELELDLEGADLFAARFLEDDVRIVVRVGVAEPAEEVRAFHLLGIASGETAEVLVADDPVVGAHPFLGADLDGVERPLVHRDERGDRHFLLERLRGQKDDLSSGREPFGERGVERGGRLAGPRRRLGEKVLAVSHGGADGFDHRFLAGSRGRVREGQALGGPGLALSGGLLSAPDAEGPPEPPLDLVLDVLVEGHLRATAPPRFRCRRRRGRRRHGRARGASRDSSRPAAGGGRARRRSPDGRTPSSDRFVDFSSSTSQ